MKCWSYKILRALQEWLAKMLAIFSVMLIFVLFMFVPCIRRFVHDVQDNDWGD